LIGDQSALLKEVVAREAAMPGDAVSVWICYHGISGNDAAMVGKCLEPLIRPVGEWPAIRAAAVNEILGSSDR
jgi:hypothetical protein